MQYKMLKFTVHFVLRSDHYTWLDLHLVPHRNFPFMVTDLSLEIKLFPPKEFKGNVMYWIVNKFGIHYGSYLFLKNRISILVKGRKLPHAYSKYISISLRLQLYLNIDLRIPYGIPCPSLDTNVVETNK